MPENIIELEPELKKDKISKDKADTILFVCTGNTCRSPMCAALFNALYSSDKLKLKADSCGLAADGSPISQNAVTALIHRGIKPSAGNDYISHISKTVTPELVRSAAIVVGITGRHAMELMFRFPDCASKITSLSRDISDPYGGNLEVYERCLAEIEAALDESYTKNTNEQND